MKFFSCGAEFSEFMEFISYKPENILLLKANFDGKYKDNICFEYADSENMEELLSDDLYSYGNSCWVDLENMRSLDLIKPVEVAELLYCAHLYNPLNSP